MIATRDIRERIESDFGNRAELVYKTFADAFRAADYLNHPRTIRCILFLAEKNFEKLKSNIEIATYDPRDVMLHAEYINLGVNERPKENPGLQ